MKQKLIITIIGILVGLSTFAQNRILINRSIKPIPLIIPSVMNPSLCPLSKSSVDLNVGQEIYFSHRGQDYLLIIISKDTPSELYVNRLIRRRKKELNL